MRKLWIFTTLTAGLALAGCQSGSSTTPADNASGGGGAASSGTSGNGTSSGSGSDGSTSNASGSGSSSVATGSPASGSALAGKWKLDILTDTEPHLVLEVAGDNSAKLLSEAGFNKQQYASIKFAETKTGIDVVVDEVQKCGNRTVTYTMTKSGDAYTGSVSGPNANCRSGTFQSPAGVVKLERSAS